MNEADLFLASDDGQDVIGIVRELKEHLTASGYQRTVVLPLPGSIADVCSDPVNLPRAMSARSNLFHRSAVAAAFAGVLGVRDLRAVELHRLFFLGRSVPARRAESILGTRLARGLLEGGVLRAVETGMVRARVLAAPFDGGLYLSDPMALQDHLEYCYLGRSTFTVPEFLRQHGSLGARRAPGERSRLLDLACGAGVGAVACAAGFDEVVGTDIVQRCLRYARLNASLNGVPGAQFHYSDVFSDVVGSFDLIISNTPCVWADTEPAQPRTYASGGSEFGLELPARMIAGSLDRLRPGGVMMAVVTAPVMRGVRYAVPVFERICAGRKVRVTLYPMLEEYELRSARQYRASGITKMVRYLAVLEPAERYSMSFGRLDTPRLLSTRARTISVRAIAGAAWAGSGLAAKVRPEGACGSFVRVTG